MTKGWDNANTTSGLNSDLPKKKAAFRPHDFFETSHNPVQGEIALWRAVIMQALTDASSQSGKAEAQQEKREAQRWLQGRSTDFATVCYHAGYEPEYVRSLAKRALDRGCKWRAEANPDSASAIRKRRKKILARSAALPAPSIPAPYKKQADNLMARKIVVWLPTPVARAYAFR